MLVTPNWLACVAAALIAARMSVSVGCGSTLSIKPVAASFRWPVGSPVLGSLTISPLGGLRVSFVMPASASAFEFTHTLWPS